MKSNTPRTPRKDSPRFFMEKLVSPRKITSPRKFSVQGDSSEFNDEISEEEYNEIKLKMKSLQTPGFNFFFHSKLIWIQLLKRKRICHYQTVYQS
jgi:hypothetical protein